MAKTSVLIVGLEPSLIDFSDPAYGASGLNAAKIRAGLEADEAHLNELGYNAELCLIDFGETAETVLRERLAKHSFDCIMVGAGVRLIAQNTFLFEKLVNIVHAGAHRRSSASTRCRQTPPLQSNDGFLRTNRVGCCRAKEVGHGRREQV